ncbi:MAG: hypothetical protein O2890_08960 [Cyanobacteria bacterium]|nr:hypothetical protein [Cyanobacteriota bacterium]MDA0866536.1 hypothetical protein [Cyanobacteriota bacterium]
MPQVIPQPLPNDPAPNRETVRHLLLGSLTAVKNTIRVLHKLGYAEPNDWSKPLPTGRTGEVMAILTKHLLLP